MDDEPLVAELLQRKLKQADTTIVTGGREALDLLNGKSEFDLVFCDLMMPTVTGMDVYEAVRVRSSARASRFVFMTGGVCTERARKFVESIPNPCIDKPFDSDTLKRVISNRNPL